MRKLAIIALLIAHAASAQVKVLASNGVRAALEALKPQVEKAAGRPLTIEYGSSAALKRTIEGGAMFDMAILTPETTADLTKSGRIASGSAVDLAHTGIGFGIRAGAPKPDISTPDAVKQMLMNASAISIVKEGASRATIDRMFDRLDLTPTVAGKTTLEAGTEQSGQSVAQGRSQVEIVPMSEIPLVPGVETLGPLPKELQNYLHFQVSLSVHAKDVGPAKKAIQFLTSAEAVPTWRAKGMEPK
jgi:molybdate transport system substrate-binding protein